MKKRKESQINCDRLNQLNHQTACHTAIRKGYEEYSVQGFYEKFGDRYKNPHETAIQQLLQIAVTKWQLNLSKVLDLACGSGEVTLVLKSLGVTDIDGIDPYTYNAYLQRTGQVAETYTFEDIASGILANRYYSLIVCSFALHLVAESRLPILCYYLSQIADALVVITPNKRPELKAEWGWIWQDEIAIERVRSRLFYGNRIQESGVRIQN